jgi:hypothetical protein
MSVLRVLAEERQLIHCLGYAIYERLDDQENRELTLIVVGELVKLLVELQESFP